MPAVCAPARRRAPKGPQPVYIHGHRLPQHEAGKGGGRPSRQGAHVRRCRQASQRGGAGAAGDACGGGGGSVAGIGHDLYRDVPGGAEGQICPLPPWAHKPPHPNPTPCRRTSAAAWATSAPLRTTCLSTGCTPAGTAPSHATTGRTAAAGCASSRTSALRAGPGRTGRASPALSCGGSRAALREVSGWLLCLPPPATDRARLRLPTLRAATPSCASRTSVLGCPPTR